MSKPISSEYHVSVRLHGPSSGASEMSRLTQKRAAIRYARYSVKGWEGGSADVRTANGALIYQVRCVNGHLVVEEL